MRKILLAAHGPLPKRPNELRGTAAQDASTRESCSLVSQAAWARSDTAEAIIFVTLPILPILFKAVPAVPYINRWS
jgi:hypothetical protein